MVGVIKVMIVDDQRMVRDGISLFLSALPDVQVVGEATDGKEAVKKSIELAPDVVLMDISLPQLDGIEATSKIKKSNPDIKIVGVSAHTEGNIIMSMLRAGAHGYVPKSTGFDELHKAILSVARNEKYLSPLITHSFIDNLVDPEPVTVEHDITCITSREQQVMRFVAEGKSSKEIAEELELSINTVIRHRHNLMDKLELRNTADITRFAIKAKLVEP